MTTAAIDAARTVHRRPGARWLWTSVALAVLIATGLFAGAGVLGFATEVLIFGLLAASLNLVVGTTGLVSLGHAAFFATGGYVAGYLTKVHAAPLWLSMPAGVIAASLLAAVVAVVSVRRDQTAFIMLTLAFAQLIYLLLRKWQTVTGGDNGLLGFAPPTWLLGAHAFYAFAAVLTVLGLATMALLVRSPFGHALRAIRDNPERAAFTGLNVRAMQIAAFTISGLFAGLAGELLAFLQRGMFVEAAGFATSTEILIICVLGGPRFFAGPLVGVLIFRGLETWVPMLTPYWLSVVALVILGVGRFLPGGVLSLWAFPRGRTP